MGRWHWGAAESSPGNTDALKPYPTAAGCIARTRRGPRAHGRFVAMPLKLVAAAR